jgi:pimeloyl-ACP methyl ester carboxylesterase
VHPQPPLRTTHAHGTPKNLLVYDRWGRFGRPVVLLHGLLFDRTMWWPLAAELAAPGRGNTCSVVAVDLPGHGDSAARADHSLDHLAHDLAMLIHRLDLHRAPVLIGHAESARLARTFADKYATHVVFTVGDADAEPPRRGEQVPAVADLDGIPEQYQQFAAARHDTGLLNSYRCWFSSPPARPAPARVPAGRAPEADLGDERFPHLRDPAGFAALLRNLR